MFEALDFETSTKLKIGQNWTWSLCPFSFSYWGDNFQKDFRIKINLLASFNRFLTSPVLQLFFLLVALEIIVYLSDSFGITFGVFSSDIRRCCSFGVYHHLKCFLVIIISDVWPWILEESSPETSYVPNYSMGSCLLYGWLWVNTFSLCIYVMPKGWALSLRLEYIKWHCPCDTAYPLMLSNWSFSITSKAAVHKVTFLL